MVDPLEIGELPPRLVRTRIRPSAHNPAPNTLFHFHPWMLPTRIASSPDNHRNCSLLLTPSIHHKHHCKRLCPPKTPRGRPARLDTLTPLDWLEHRKRLSSPLIVGVKAQLRQQHQHHHHHHPTLLILTYRPDIDSTTTTRSAIFPPPNHPRRRILSCLSLSTATPQALEHLCPAAATCSAYHEERVAADLLTSPAVVHHHFLLCARPRLSLLLLATR